MQENINLKVFAKWNNRNAIFFHANGGVGALDYQIVPEGSSIQLPSNIFTYNGYDFIGWGTSPIYGEGIVYAEGVTFDMTENGGCTLYAVWHYRTATLILHRNIDSDSNSYSISADTNHQIFSPFYLDWQRVGYNFLGWATSSTGSVVYEDEANINLPVNTILELYAIWQAKTCVITFSIGFGENKPTDVIATFGEEMPEIVTMPTKAGYTFNGFWNSPFNSERVQYYNADLSSARTWDNIYDSYEMLFAEWILN